MHYHYQSVLVQVRMINSILIWIPKDFQAKMSNENFQTYTPILGKKSTLWVSKLSPRPKSPKTVVSKPRLCVTPGKIFFNKKCKPKRTYLLPDLLPETNKPSTSKTTNISPQARNIYAKMGNYNYVVSPVGLYIKGIKSPHLKSPRSDNMETPEDNLSPKKKTPTQSRSQKIKSKRPKEVNRIRYK